MRRVASLAAFLAFAGCAEGDSGVIAVVSRDSAVAEDTAVVADTATDSTVTDLGSETESDVGGDTFVPDTFVPDSATDTFVADTFMADTFVADTFVADTGPVDAGAPYTHTISVDGTNDFDAVNDKFTTTSTGYDAYVAWDAVNLYIGYAGADLGTGASSTKWVLVYLDADPGMTTGALSSERYNTQTLRFPTGFGAEYYARFRTDNMDSAIKRWDGASWAFVSTTLTRAKLGGYVELQIPRASLGGGTTFGLVTYMINEAGGVESTYAGLFAGNFTDGYSGSSAPKTLTKYLLVDASASAPTASTRIKP